MSSREAEKGQGYINALDNARSEDKWHEVPELIRKVTKHAPHRKCLIQTANAEVQVIAHIHNKRPSTAKGQTSPNQVSNLSELIPTLLSAIEQADGTPQDVFQAQVCLGWIHWILSEPGLAIGRLPKDFDESSVNDLSHATEGIAKWTEICIIKGGYLKFAAQCHVSGSDDALNTASSVLPRLATPRPTIASYPQALYWSERFLSKLALIAGEKVSARDPTSNDTSTEIALKAFRLWSVHPQVKRTGSSGYPYSQSAGASEPPSQTSMWMSYYELLSTILQHNMTYFPPSQGPTRGHLATEIRRVEAVCESVLLREVRFPKANARNPQVESWVGKVIRNWEVLCGPGWRDDDFGEGGQDAVGRNVLDILYRAATKTYHSYLILRRLFHVHAALAEFELAIKALDSYIEIVVSAKERAEKAAEAGELEKDGILLETVSEGVIILSCFGSQKEAEKARSLIEILEKFLEKDISTDLDRFDVNGRALHTGTSDAVDRVSPKTVAMAFRAIGIGLANWSRWTPVNESRDEIRAEAIENLERSVAPELGDEFNLSSLYALALLLAESRDLDSSIAHVKTALSTKSPSSDLTDVAFRSDQSRLSRERDLIPLWHLLALLLSAKQEFDIAGRSCEAAFEQFPTTVFSNSGKRRHRDGSQRGRRDSTEIRMELLQHLRGREKERILETRMSQLALIEVLEGPEAALNHSDHLLTLFGTLFEHFEFERGSEKAPKSEKQLAPPKSSAGTVKSFRGSIFGKKKGSRAPERNANGSEKEAIPAVPIRESASPTDAPTIQVTDETTGGSVFSHHQANQKLHRRDGSPKGPHQVDETRAASKLQNGDEDLPPAGEIGVAVSDPPVSPTSTTEPKQSAKQPLPPVAHNMKHDREPAPAGHALQPPEQDVRLPPPHRFESPTRALTWFPEIHAQKHALTVLVKVWLLIAGLYRRASLFEDAREAWEEAFKQATKFEALVSAQESSARAFSERSWGVGKSADELFGDVYAERGALSEAQSLLHEAMEHYEEALMRYSDHPKATIGLANLLLDIWEEKITAEIPRPGLEANISSTLSFSKPQTHMGVTRLEKSTTAALIEAAAKDERASSQKDDEQKYMGRLAARDRAYGLLSTLTKLGSSWDNSEAWFALSRAYEAGSQLEKTKEVLWWCVELEDRKPIRHWWNLGSGGYVL